MVDFVSEVPEVAESTTAFPALDSPAVNPAFPTLASPAVNPAFVRSLSAQSTVDNSGACLAPMRQAFAFGDSQGDTPQMFMSLGQLSSEYATYLLLTQSGFDNNAIMAAAAFQKIFPLITATQAPLNSLTSLLPYANMLSLASGFDTNNLLGNLQILQAAVNAISSLEQQQLNDQQQQPLTVEASSATTCASSTVAPSKSPLNESNNNAPTDPLLLINQQLLPITPSSSPSFNIDESLRNSISKNKLGRSYNPGRPLAMADRQRILDLYKKGYKISHIARIIGVTHSCVSKIMTRYRRTGSMHPRSAQMLRKHSSNSSPTRSSTSPFSTTEASLIFTNTSTELSDSASSTCSFLVPQTPTSVPSPLTTSSLLYNGLLTTNMTSANEGQLSKLLIHKPIPLKSSVYCGSS